MVTASEQGLDWEHIVDQLSVLRRGYPVQAARAVLDDAGHYERLLAEFERMSNRPDELADSMLYLQAMHLLAEKRERRALRPLLRIAALPEAALDAALGDHLTESLARCVAAVCDDESLIREFVENRQHAPWARYVMVGALVNRVFAGDAPAEPLLEWVQDLGKRTLAWIAEQPATVDCEGDELLMDALAGAIAKIGRLEHLAVIQRWWDADCLDPQIAGLDRFTKELNRSWDERLERFNHYRKAYVPDAIGEMQQWYCFSDRFHDERARPKPAPHDSGAAGSFVREAPKLGRNDPCSCGSGKKYKKCCGA
ncbi:MAG: DUF1186 domain-containing protein [Azonexus sp.]|nr:DUF1186 domain-containing protein [Azonexus sp.]